MKRRLALSLAALLLLGCLTPALAAEGDAELSLYQQYGPWGEWPQEQKDAAEETWTDGQWDDYWTEYDAQMWAALNRYNEDYDRWSYARFGDPWDEYLRVEKEEMGMPYPDGINVSLNGAYLDFGGTAPLAASGCTMVPFRAFLEGLGAEVAFDGSRIAAVLENGDSLELVLGATELTVTQGGRITTLDMGAAPFVQDGHTYIPVRAAAEALGLDVYWDDTYEAAHLTDYAALTAELDSRFTAANGIWAAIRDTIPREAGKGYESTASMRLSATLYGEEEHDTASLTMEVKQLTRDGSYRMEQEQQVDLGGLGDTLFAGLSPEELAQLENHSVTLYDRESGTLYQKGVQLYSLEGEPLPDDVWVSTQVGELPAVNTLSLPGTLGELLVEAYGHSWYYYRSSPWETVMDSALPVRLLLDDGNFTRSASGGRTNYRWAVDLPALLERARMLGVMEDAPAVEGLPALDMHGEAVLRGGALEKLDGSGQMELDVLGIPADAGFTLDAAPGRLELEMEFTGAYIGKVELSLNGRVTETAAQPVTTPPAGETVERLEVLSGQVEPGVPADLGAARYVQCLLDARLGRGYDPEFLTALGETEESLSAQIAEENVQALCNLLIIEFPTEEIRGEAAGLLEELYAKADYTVGAAVPTGNGSEVEITVRPVDALARVNDALWERLDAFNAGYTGDTSTDEGYAAYDAALAEDALALFREKLAEAEYLSETVCTVTVLDGPGGTIEAGRDSLDTVYGALFPIWMLQET